MNAVKIKNGVAVCAVAQLVPGQRVDLQNDYFADPEAYQGGETVHPEFESEFEVVDTIEHESPECVCVTFESGFACGFPPDHDVTVDGEQDLAALVKEAYEGGVCPDCGESIPADVKEGETCKNCGHAFFALTPDDG